MTGVSGENKTTRPIFAIDPGNTESAYCVYFPDTHTLGDFGKVENAMLREILQNSFQWPHEYAIEMIASYGMPVGASVFETCLWIGRFQEMIKRRDEPVSLVYRKAVKIHLCGSHQAKDANIRQAIIDQFPATGGGKNPVVGIKSKPGPLFGVSADVWSAIAVALTFANQQARAAA